MAQSLESAQANAGAFLATRARLGLKAESAKRRDLQHEMDRRTRWAESRQAELERDLATRLAWAEQLNTDIETARVQLTQLNEELEARTDWARSLEHELQDERQYRTETVAQLQDELREERSRLTHAYSEQKRLGSELQRVSGRLQERQSELAALRAELQQERQERRATEQRLRGELDKVRNERDRVHFEFDRVLASSSWRLTRPFRAARRMAATLWQARIYNPMRWPMLFARGLRLVTTSGLGGAARRLNQSAQSQAEPSARPAARPVARPAPPAAAIPAAPARPDPTTAAAEPASERPLPATTDEQPDSNPDSALKAESVESTPRAPADAAEELPPLPGFPEVAEPRVSIVIPAYNHWEYTHRCLASLAATSATASFEVIVVDDASSEEPPAGLTATPGLRTLRNAENLGFIGTCNAGAAAARGEFLVLLNNDTEVRDGWLDELLRTFETAPDTGLVGARLIYPDGRLQECGGMIFSDGSGWNYGRNDDPDRPEYQYPREVDYCSGACIMLRSDVFRELGGFDTHYAPAYYEDTDLAFRVRERDLKVRVQPAAEVIHHEGVTSGTDTGSATAIKRYQEVNREKFLARWQEALSRQPPPIADPNDLATVRRSRDHRLRGRILVIDATTPEPDQDSGSVRLTNLMQCFLDLGYGVTFFADNRMHAGRYTRQLQARGIEVWTQPWIQAPGRFFEEHGGDFDFVFISRHYVAVNYLSLLRRHCPDTPFIFDTVDLHYLREMRLAELENSTALRQVAKQTRRSELGVIAAADVTLVVSPAEVEVLSRDAPGAHVHVVSNIHDVPGRSSSFEDREGLFFVGGYQHPPNVDAARWFVQEVWPGIRERLPGVPFHLIGSKAPPEVEALAGDGVVFHGFVESLEPFLHGCRLAVAPLRYGAGVKGKVNMSMSYGQPVVATPIAVEGMYAEDGHDVLVADTAEAFANQVVRLYQDPDLWQTLSDAAIENVRRHFSLEAARASLSRLLESLRRTDG